MNKKICATVGSVIAVIKKTIKVSGSESGFKTVVSRKKRKEGVLAEGIDNRKITGDTTESESINMKEECLVKETSIDYGKGGAFMEEDPNQTPKGLCVKTKKMLGKPLGVIDYGTVNTDNDVLDNFSLLPLPLPIKPTEKLSFIRKIFSSVNGFGGASTPSKFGGIICVTFTSEKAMMAAKKLANNHGVMVNTDLKHPLNNHMDQAIVIKEIPVGTSVEAVCAAVSEFGLIKSIKMQLVGLWQKSILIGKDAVRVTRADDFIGLVGGKTCVIDCNPVNYACACCATVCFRSEFDLVSAMAATPIIKEIGLCWFRLSLTLCSVCGLFGYISLNCVSVKKGISFCSGLGQIGDYLCLKIRAHFLSIDFSDKTWALVVGAPPVCNSHGAGLLLGSDNVGKSLSSTADDLEKCLVHIESSLVSLTRQIGKLVKRLESFVLAVSQPSPGCQLLVISSSQNQGENIVMGVSSGNATSDKTAAILDSTASSEIVKLENMLKGLFALVIILSAHLNGLALTGGALPLPLS
ncbi:hypothetical protein G9A89_017423 [Geosiphon pyriformis]|nr:hypothetical protein G9A89_017423 [Geosiphon pyriformis]